MTVVGAVVFALALLCVLWIVSDYDSETSRFRVGVWLFMLAAFAAIAVQQLDFKRLVGIKPRRIVVTVDQYGLRYSFPLRHAGDSFGVKYDDGWSFSATWEEEQ